jgi:FKBP-type peptidyl-prolyl cis-trans isomerase 2
MGPIPTPGQRVQLASAPEWGAGQVQSVVGRKVTVNFEHAGKQTVHIDVAPLNPVEPPAETL